MSRVLGQAAVVIGLCVISAGMVGAQSNPEAARVESASFVVDLLAAQIVGDGGQYQEIGVAATLEVAPVSFVGGMSFRNDGKYGEVQSGFWLGFGAEFEEGGVLVDLSPFNLRAGRFPHADLVDSPYSLFVSSVELSAVLLEFSVTTPRLFYSSRWLELNRNSALGYPDRGANLRSYGISFEPFRFGFQDVVVYSGRTFDLEYLVNPLPGFFLQYITGSGGVPWREAINDNSIMGFFLDYSRPELYAYGQILIDDLNTNAVLAPDSFQNPSKVAWSLGGRYALQSGTIGLYHAGATKYTFQAYGAGSPGSATDTKYGYVYYPDVTYPAGGTDQTIVPEENYIGYLHGENNIALLADYQTLIGPVAVKSTMELTVSGSKSPANPWHELNSFSEGGQGTRFLDDERLETRLVTRGRGEWVLGPWTVFADLELGYVWNELELTPVPPALSGGDPDNSIPYFAPGTTNRFLGTLRIGGSYTFPLVANQ